MLTQRQLQLLQFIASYQQGRGVPPSFDEMRDALELRSKSGIHRLISGLVERGYIRRLPNRARAIEVIRPPSDTATGAARSDRDVGDNVVRGQFGRQRPEPPALEVTLPIFGRIAAGTPSDAIRDTGTVVEVPSIMLGDGEHYVLQVVGDSMIEAGIMDGDLVVIRCTEIADNGDIIVALVDGQEATLKRLRRRGGAIALESANPKYRPRIFHPDQVRVQGRLVGLLRRY